jgi:hypothetical protein
MLNAVIESLQQLKLSIKTKSTRLNADMLRKQTLGTVMPDPCTSAQADILKANATVILDLYGDDSPEEYSGPTIMIGGKENRMRAAVVRTYYDSDLEEDLGGPDDHNQGPDLRL